MRNFSRCSKFVLSCHRNCPFVAVCGISQCADFYVVEGC